MRTAPEHIAYEAWIDQYPLGYPGIEYDAFVAGYRAAMQSQDKEDALRYRWLMDNAQLFSHFGEEGNSGWCVMRRDSAIKRVFTYNHAELDEAIDHARHIEGDGG